MIIDDSLGKITFQCKHCGNDDLRYMQFASLNNQSPQYKNNLYRQNWDYETTPKIPIGIHIKCAKCGKDTFIIPNYYGGTEWGNDIPQQCMTHVQFQQPEYSDIKYIINPDGFLDRIVVTSQNKYISMITEEVLPDGINNLIIDKAQYETLLGRGLKEVTKVTNNNDNIIIQPENKNNVEVVTPPATTHGNSKNSNKK